jgi:hypothetical protein
MAHYAFGSNAPYELRAAKVHGLTLVTRNVRDIATAGVPLFDPFTAWRGIPER